MNGEALLEATKEDLRGVKITLGEALRIMDSIPPASVGQSLSLSLSLSLIS